MGQGGRHKKTDAPGRAKLARAADLPKAVFDLTAVDEIVGFSSLRWTAGPVSKTSPPPIF
jgi:hypothetical protein